MVGRDVGEGKSKKEIEDIPVLRTRLGSSNRAGFILSIPGLQTKQLKAYR
jgi:hypothetical protein